jgi:hypothetical protein
MVQLQTDGVGHINYGTGPGGVVTSGVPQFSAFSSTWASGAAGVVTGNDTAGVITFTATGVPAAGTVVQVFFVNPYPTAPRAVLVQGGPTDQSSPPLFTVSAIGPNGFTIAAAAGAAKAYSLNYLVLSA